MNAALLAGIFAGYAIAVPVGVIAVLIIEAGMAGGLRRGFAAGAGAATVDLIYCVTALFIGGVLSQVLASVLLPLQVLSGVVLISIGAGSLRALAGAPW
jgi:threonine/homoserine/homoserine lactone efflux protein